MSSPRNYKDLDVWKQAIKLAVTAYRISERLPPSEKFGLRSQLRRAAVSVAANIAEGAERHGAREYSRFLGIASGSLAEVETHLIICAELGMIQPEDMHALEATIDRIGRMLTGLKRALRSKA